MKILQEFSRSIRLMNLHNVPGFGVAFALVAAATLVNLLVWPHGSSEDGHYFALVLAVLVSALWRGLTPGLWATALAGVSSSFFTLAPQFSIRIADPNAKRRLVVFLVEGVLLSLAARVIRKHHMIEARRMGADRYLVLMFAVGAATTAKLIFPELARELPFAFNFAAICACAMTGGVISGIVATALLAGLTKFLFLEPLFSLSVANPSASMRVGAFVVEGLLLSVLGDSHLKLKRLAASASARARTYMNAVLNKEANAAALRAVSRDTVWELDIDMHEFVRTPSWQDSVSSALPERETFASWVGRIHAEDRDATIKRLLRAIKEGREELQYTYRLREPGGTFLSVWDSVFIVRGADWKPLRVIGRSAERPPPGSPS